MAAISAVELGDVEPGWVLRGHYLGTYMFGPCESWDIVAE